MEFFRARARHIAYGGARGGGKSWAMRTKFVMLACHYDGIKILLLRRTLPELRENHVVPLLQLLNGIARYNATERVFTFKNGSRIKLGYCAAENDVYQYQGQEYDVIGLEEATHFTESQMQFLTTCNRTTRTDFTPRMYYTCNPGGVGHAWVKRLFVDRNYQGDEQADDYVFVRAKIFDNYVLMQNDPGYLKTLKNLPGDLRRAHLDGDWDVYAGQYYAEFRRDVHTCQPFEIPAHWRRYRAIDYGLDMLACVWAAFDELGNAYVYREYCAPDRVVSLAARDIIDRTSRGEDVICTYAPADLWGRTKDTGRTQAEIFAQSGLPLVRVKNTRADGWINLKEWLKPVPDGAGNHRPRLMIFDTCEQLIRCIPLLQHDDVNPNDCATEPHDITHAPDALRYLLDGRPRCADAPEVPADEDYIDYDDQVNDFLNYGR